MSLLDEFSINDIRYNRKHYFNKNGQIRKIEKDPDNLNNQGHLNNLHKKSRPELLDLLARQNKLLKSRKFISSLPDKGEKISNLKEKIEEALKSNEETEAVENLLSRLDINKPSKREMEGFEWTKDMKSSDVETVVEYDSDDDKQQPDPFTVLASYGHAVRKKIKEKPLIEPKDVENTNSDLGNNYAGVLISKAENAVSDDSKFCPWRSLKHDSKKEGATSLQKKSWWEVTAATDPSYKFSKAQTLTLQESMRLEKEQGERIRELEMKRAVEKLTGASGSWKIGSYVPSESDEYREKQLDSDDSDDEQQVPLDDDT